MFSGMMFFRTTNPGGTEKQTHLLVRRWISV